MGTSNSGSGFNSHPFASAFQLIGVQKPVCQRFLVWYSRTSRLPPRDST